MELALLLHNLGALGTLVLGGLGLLRPEAVSRLVGLAPAAPEGRSELRATYGGFFAALGAFALLAQDQVAFTALGAAWLAAGLGRALSAWLDGVRTPRNYAAIAFEGAFGLLLLIPA